LRSEVTSVNLSGLTTSGQKIDVRASFAPNFAGTSVEALASGLSIFT
jgi:hypothetical protein